MPKLIRLIDGRLDWADDPFAALADEEAAPASGGVIVSLARLRTEGEALAAHDRPVGVRLNADEAVETIAPDLARLPVVALVFPKFRDGRPFSAATLLRERYGYAGEVRAVGEVLREQANFMIRCGFNAFEPVDGATPDDFARKAALFRHVYQAAADSRAPVFVEREGVR